MPRSMVDLLGATARQRAYFENRDISMSDLVCQYVSEGLSRHIGQTAQPPPAVAALATAANDPAEPTDADSSDDDSSDDEGDGEHNGRPPPPADSIAALLAELGASTADAVVAFHLAESDRTPQQKQIRRRIIAQFGEHAPEPCDEDQAILAAIIEAGMTDVRTHYKGGWDKATERKRRTGYNSTDTIEGEHWEAPVVDESYLHAFSLGDE